MDDRISFIQLQLWVVIAILAILVCSNVARSIVNRRRGAGATEPPFKEMWESGNVHELEIAATSHLRKYPNSLNARLYLAKSLAASERYKEAIPHMQHLQKIEPAWDKMMHKMIAEITNRADGS